MNNQTGMKNAIKLYFNQYFVFKGKSTRAQYWWIVLFNLIVTTILSFIIPFATDIYTLAVFIPSLAILTRRYQDVGFSFLFSLIFMLFNTILAFLIIFQTISILTPEMINDMYNNYAAFENALNEKFIVNGYIMSIATVLVITSFVSLIFTLLPSNTIKNKKNQQLSEQPLVLNVDLSNINDGVDSSLEDDDNEFSNK